MSVFSSFPLHFRTNILPQPFYHVRVDETEQDYFRIRTTHKLSDNNSAINELDSFFSMVIAKDFIYRLQSIKTVHVLLSFECGPD